MAQNNLFQGELDPEIAALIGADPSTEKEPQRPIPDYSALFDENIDELDEADKLEDAAIDLTERAFPEVTQKFESVPHGAFDDPTYYKTALSGEGDITQRVHTILQQYVNAKDPKDRSVYRQQFATAYWEFMTGVARKSTGKISDPKKFLLRFGILHPTFIKAEDRDFFAKIVVNNTLGVPIYYVDEWLKAIGQGIVRNSATDEVRIAKNNTQIRLQQLLEKAQGKRDTAKSLLLAKNDERLTLEKVFRDQADILMEHYPISDFPSVNACYTDAQRRVFGELQELMKRMLKADRDVEIFLRDFNQAEADVKSLMDKVEEGGAAVTVDIRALNTEFDTIRQMAKMTIGRQGNHFPILSGEYFRCSPNDVAFRENVISTLAWIESVDPEAFCRSYKTHLNRIVPYVVLIPTYGDIGICWEPFDRFNRATSRGRLALPLYPKNLLIATLSAVADLRWQVAKEKASYYWMEEGLTGYYYQWFTSRKLKGDVKEYFIQDYITWITKESDAIQKLDKEVRGIFWRYVPFAKKIKEKLKDRSYTYQDLYQKDINRSLSDGY